jgi:hypothetical protein
MKTIIVIAALAISGSCFADSQDEIMATVNRIDAANRARDVALDKIKPETYRPDPSVYQAPKVDFTIVTLPSGKTATALTFK